MFVILLTVSYRNNVTQILLKVKERSNDYEKDK